MSLRRHLYAILLPLLLVWLLAACSGSGGVDYSSAIEEGRAAPKELMHVIIWQRFIIWIHL